jgi:hypothetical protein
MNVSTADILDARKGREIPNRIQVAMEETLTEFEQKVIKLWLAGKPKYEAWAYVMRPGLVLGEKNAKSVRTQSSRFWNTRRMVKITRLIEEWLFETDEHKEKKRLAKERSFVNAGKQRIPKQQPKIIVPDKSAEQIEPEDSYEPDSQIPERFDDIPEQDTTREPEEHLTPFIDNKKKESKSPGQPISKKRSYADQRKAWLESFQDIENPSATTPYGIGLWLATRVLAQMNKREEWIKTHNKSPFDKDGCPYTNVDISAIKTVLAALLPFAPAPTNQEIKQLTTAGLIVSLTAEEMGIDPDEYVAPCPPGVKSHENDFIDTNAEQREVTE